MPPRFKCAVGGEWKLSSEFSQNQLKLWTQRKRHDNDGITSANIGLVCKAHNSGPQLAQVKCQGPCGLRKHREAFSKRQRNQPDAVSISKHTREAIITLLTCDSGASNVRSGRSVTPETSPRVLPRTPLCLQLSSPAFLTSPSRAITTIMKVTTMTTTAMTMTTMTTRLAVSWSRLDEAFFKVLIVTPKPMRTTRLQRIEYVYLPFNESLYLKAS